MLYRAPSRVPGEDPRATESDTARRIARIGALTTGLLFTAWVVDYIDRLVIALALPDIGKAFHVDKAEQGLVVTVFFLAYMACQVPGGLLADRFGSRPMMVIALVAWSLFTGFTGLVAGFAVLLLVRILFGVSEGIFPGASIKALSERTLPSRRGAAIGTMLSSNSLGAALAPLIAAPAMALVGWRSTFLLVAGLGLVMAVILWRFLPRKLSREELGGASGEAESSDGAAAQKPVPSWMLLRTPAMWKFAALLGGGNIVAYGLLTWVPSYFMDVRHVQLADTGWLAAIPWFVAAASTVLGGWLFDRYFHDRARLMVVPSFVLGGIFIGLMMVAHSTAAFTTYLTIGNAIMALPTMAVMGLPLRVLPTRIVGTGMGLLNLGGQLAGAITPLVMGILVDNFSYTVAFSFMLVGVVASIAGALWVPQTTDQFARSAPAGLLEAA